MAATIDELLDAIDANRGYFSEDSLEKAKAYEAALVGYMHLTPASQSDQGSSLAYDMATCRYMLGRVTDFISAKQALLAASASNARVRFLSAGEGFRR